MTRIRAVHALFSGAGSGMLKMISMRGSFRLLCSHPLLILVLLFLIHFYRSFPLAFHLLVSASPVILCTAALLGVLLSFGQKGIQVTENSQKMSNDFGPLKTCLVEQTSVAQRDLSQAKSRFSEVRNEIIEKEIKEFQPGLTGASKIMENDCLVIDSIPVNVGSSRDMQLEGQPVEKADGGKAEQVNVSIAVRKIDTFYSSSLEPDMPFDDDGVQKSLDSEFDVADKSSIDVSVAADTITTLNEIDPLLGSENRQCTDLKEEDEGGNGEEGTEEPEEPIEDCDDDDDENEDCRDKPVITWTEDDQKNLIDLNSSELERDQCLENLIARRSHRNDIEGREVTDGEDDEEEMPRVEEEDVNPHVMTWTEDDEKNLNDLGSSELERDQRLENLIARRRVWRNFSVIPDFNLIDLDTVHHSFQVPPVSTARVNPFDIPDESNNQSCILPIPGSAPSVSLPRQNPFDYPDVFSEVKLGTEQNMGEELVEVAQKKMFDFIGQGLDQGIMEMNKKDGHFRRHRSFSWSSNLNLEEEILKEEVFEISSKDVFLHRYQSFGIGESRQDKWEFTMLSPYFVPEHVAAGDEGINHPSFQSLLMDASDDTTSSSASETESTAINNVDMELINRGTEALPQINVDHQIELGSHSFEHGNAGQKEHDDRRVFYLAESSATKASHEAESYTSERENLEGSLDEINVKTKGNNVKHSDMLSLFSSTKASEVLEPVKEDDRAHTMEQVNKMIVEDPGNSSTSGLLHVPDT